MNNSLKTTTIGQMLFAALALVFATVVCLPAPADASTAANTAITNTATVNYKDAGGGALPQVTATATVTVTLLPAGVTISSPGNQSINQGTSATLVYTITANANGQDTYNLGSVATPNTMSAVTPTLPASIVLGGTTLALQATVGSTTITVPYDGNPANGAVNGLVPGSVIQVGTNTYTIAAGAASITKNVGANTATITLTSAIIGSNVIAGTIVGEQKTFNVVVPSGLVSSGNSGTQTVSTTATSGTAPNPVVTQTTPTVITVNKPSLSVQKLVSVDNGTTFAISGNAPPATTLIYKIIVSNTGVGDATAVTITDTIPGYLTYDSTGTGSAKYATAVATTYAAATSQTDGADGDYFTFAAGTATLAYGPNLSPGSVVVLFYKATIN